MTAHRRDQVFRVGVIQPALGVGILQVEVVYGPVERIALRLRRLGYLLVDLLPGFEFTQTFLQRGFPIIASNGGGLLVL